MASFNSGNYPGGPSFESLLIQNLMGELQLRPSSLDTNSFLSQTLDDFLLQDDPLSPGKESDEATEGGGRGRSLLSREEAKLEKEIIRVIRSGSAHEALKPNSGQSVSIGDHNVCVGCHEEPGSEYRVWEWHGHLMLFDDEDGFCPEYVYGNYFERVPLSAGSKEGGDERGGEKKDARARLRELIGEEDVEVGKEKKGAYSGLRELIADDVGTASSQRVLHRNSLRNGMGK